MNSPGNSRRHDELRDFLRNRRERLTPADVGLPPGARRRTPGLRREEVALLAGVGVSWYTWLEQGRDITASGAVVDAIARALLLAEPDRRHLHLLAGLPAPTGSPPSRIMPDAVQRMLDNWLPYPAYVVDRHWNYVAHNAAVPRILGHSDTDGNCLKSFFTNERYRAVVKDLDGAARDIVGRFRAESARFPDDPEFARIATELSAVSEEFAVLWARHDVFEAGAAIKRLHHPEVGDLVFETVVMALPDRPGEHVMLQHPHPDSDTAAKVEALMSLTVS